MLQTGYMRRCKQYGTMTPHACILHLAFFVMPLSSSLASYNEGLSVDRAGSRGKTKNALHNKCKSRKIDDDENLDGYDRKQL